MGISVARPYEFSYYLSYERSCNFSYAACDAILAVEGLKVAGGDGGHRLRLDKVEVVIGGDHASLFELLDEGRVSRNEASYAVAPVPPPDAQAMARAVQQLVQLADERVAPHLPAWKEEG